MYLGFSDEATQVSKIAPLQGVCAKLLGVANAEQAKAC